MSRKRWITVMIVAGLVVAGCATESSEEDRGADAADAKSAVATGTGQAGDACALIRADEVAAIVGEPVTARPEGVLPNKSSCMYENEATRMTWFGITVTWSGGRESWEIMQSGTALAVEIMGEEFSDVNVDSIVTPGPVPGLGDAAVFSDIMPSAILEGDVLIEMLVTFLPEPERHFVPLGRKALARL
ncbi:MAG TPA: hypothetical protein VFA45_17250 [Actinomycetes bacterium]|nr:hypothetical protein [Actinomycetes bacterium]